MQIILSGKPITKKNSSKIVSNSKKTFFIPSKQFIKYEKDCRRQITRKHKLNIYYPINLQAVYYMPTKHRVDLTNLLNATNDILVDCNVLKDDNRYIIANTRR